MRIDFNNNIKPSKCFFLLEHVIFDRGSLYSVSYGKVRCRQDIKLFLQKIKHNKRYKEATHNTWATRVTKAGAVYESKNDDGEKGAGMVILTVMRKHDVTDCVICVTRWFGGVKLMGNRYKHVKNATLYAVEDIINKS